MLEILPRYAPIRAETPISKTAIAISGPKINLDSIMELERPNPNKTPFVVLLMVISILVL